MTFPRTAEEQTIRSKPDTTPANQPTMNSTILQSMHTHILIKEAVLLRGKLVYLDGDKEVVETKSVGAPSPTLHTRNVKQSSIYTTVIQKCESHKNGTLVVSVNIAKDIREHSRSSLPTPGVTSDTRWRNLKDIWKRWSKGVSRGTGVVVARSPTTNPRFSFFSSHNPDVETQGVHSTTSPTTRHSSGFVPRHAASGFLRTATPRRAERA
jgi:hypothetical protein